MTDTPLNRLVESDARHSAAIHRHDQGQLTYIERGVLSLEADGGIWAIPPGHMHWIPAGVEHASRSHGQVRFWLTLVPEGFADRLPRHTTVLEASPLLISALDRLRGLEPNDAFAGPLLDIIAHEIHAGAQDAPGIRLPAASKMRDWALAFLAAPNIKTSIDTAAAGVAMSRRSFTRHFEREVGMTFAAWKRAVIVHRATVRLAEGASVGDVALDAGYESVSAFIAMFKAVGGRLPGDIRRRAEA
ncbi:AraC family transcriptional regulator [Pleomorphomonas oryzae]|uniref:AraC family transcriptional regulator n=1 Tax=Pleomorphomonas oryzae TaxID=261934 RepID=UPI00042A9387|nr:helix-turn-helix transcriptional regulator [Pleomorphomonas oryzae]